MKTIVFVTSYPLNDEPVVKNRLVPYIETALSRGHQVCLISSDTENFSYFVNKKFKHILVPLIAEDKKNLLKRSVYESRLALKLLRAARAENSDAVIVTIPSIFLLFFSNLLNKKNIFLDVRDLAWEYLSERRILTRWAKYFFRFLAKRTLGNFDHIAVTNMTEYSHLLQFFSFKKKQLMIVSNGVSRRQFATLSEVGTRDSDESISISYIGNIGIAQNLTVFLDAAKELPNVTFNVVGGGNDFERIKAYKEKLGLLNVNLTGRLDWSEIPEIYFLSSILYAQLSEDFSGAMPSKLYEYLSTGKFVIYGGKKQAGQILSEFDNNFVISPDNYVALVEAIKKVVSLKKYRMVSRNNILKIKNKYIREDGVLKYINIIEKCKI